MKRLHSLSYKTLFAILFFTLAGIVFFIKIGGKTEKVSAAWWDEMWHYRKAISITNSSGSDLTDFQVALSIGTSQLITDGKMQTDCDDIRITDINGNLLPYWIEENNPGCNSATGDTKIWLKANSLPTSGATVYIYYGNQSAQTASSVANTFGPLQKLSLGSSYTTTPSPHASYPDNGGTQLTNGLIRENLYLSQDEATVGWNYQNPVITINLNRITVISSFRFYLGGGGAGGINIPTQIVTNYSLDNSTYNQIGVGSSWTNTEQWVTINNNSLVVAKYGQSIITSNQWAMVGEVEIYGYPGSSITANTSSTIQSEELSPAPIAYWKFDEGNGTTSYDSMGINNGTIYGTTWQNEDQCISGKCLYFNGTASDYVSIPNSKSLQITGNQTISMWLKPTAFGARRNPIDKAYGGEGTITLESNGSMNYYWGTAGTNTSPYQGFSSSSLTLNQWNLISLVRDITNNKLTWYINGKQTNQVTPAYSQATASTTNIRLGTGYAGSFIGYMDEVKLYPYARTADQIKLDYNSRGSLSSSGVNMGSQDTSSVFLSNGLVGYWKMDEGSGNTISNSYGDSIVGTTVPAWSSGKFGNSISLNGSTDKVVMSSSNPIGTAENGFSLSAWIYQNNSSQSGKQILFMGSIQLRPGIFYTQSNNGWESLSFTAPNSQSWHHLTATFDGQTMKIYVDGTLSGQKTVSIDVYNASNFIIGGRYDDAEDFSGKIDEVRVYNRVLSATEIQQLYNYTPGQNNLKSSLIAYYSLDENNGTTVNSSVGSYTGSLGGTSPTWSNNCQSGKCVNFTSANSNNILTNVNYNNSSEYTISAYIYPTSLAEGTQFKTILGSVMGNNLDSGLVLEPNGANICYHNFYGSGDINYCSNSNPIIVNKWQYVALTFNNNDVNVYYDGVNVKNVSIGKTNSSAYAIIGGPYNDSYSGARFFNGLIDEVKIYNRALTANEIKQDYNAGSAIQFGSTTQNIGGTTTSLDYCIPGDTSYCAAPVAEWKMDEGIGTSIVDTSGNGYNGIFNGSPTFTQGKIGKALNFTYADNSSVTTTFNSQLTNYTAEAWIKPISFQSGNWNTIMAASSSYPLWFGVNSSGEVFAHAFTDSTADKTTSGANIEINKWYYIAISATQNGTATIYVNGVGLTSFNSDNISWPSNSVITLGDLRSERNLNFNGIIDQAKIYNYIRTPAQIAYDYNKGAPVAWYKFDECQGSTAYDWSGNQNNGTITIGTSGSQNSLGTCAIGTSAAWTNGATGKINSSLNFDGTDDQVNIGDVSSLEGMSGITTSAWIYRTADKNNLESLLSKFWDGSNRSYAMFINSDDKLRCLIPTDTNNDNTSAYGSVINLNKWTFVSCTWDNNSHLIKAYINGNLVGQQVQNGNYIRTNTSPVLAGRDYYSGNYINQFQGQIDDIRIYNYALTSEQVKQVYNGGSVNFN